MATAEELFDGWGAAWVTRDDAERLRLFRQVCTEDVEFVPPDERPIFKGVEALAEHVSKYTAAWPDGVRVELREAPETHHGWSRGFVKWIFPTATAVGCDLIRIVDDKIAQMVVFTEKGAS